MNSTRGNWLRYLLAGLAVAAAHAGASTAWAQGFGPDPFQPYNAQFEPFSFPTGPTAPGVGQGAAINMRSGVRGANQWEAYQNALAGAGRAGAERFGIGMPYYRAAVDSRLDKDGKREYRPNRKFERAYEQTQELIAQKYLAYFSERDPAKRAALLRDYSQTQRRVVRAQQSTTGADPSRILDAATQLDTDRRSTPTTLGRDDDPRGSGNSMLRSSEAERSGSARSRSRSIPPAPALPPGSAPRPRRTPAEVLDRAQRTTGPDGLLPGTRARSATERRARPGSTPPAPPLSE